MTTNFTFDIKRIDFDENYRPADNTRITTNFANLARGERREENLRDTLEMINSRFNGLAHWDNPNADRYTLKLEIISVDIEVQGSNEPFPSIEILETSIFDRQTNRHLNGIVGNNFSSYVRDYDFSVLLLNHNKDRQGFSVPENFGDLHGKLFKHFVASDAYQRNFSKPPVICLSVSDNKIYTRTGNEHPVLGFEYTPNESSLTEQYFKQMGLNVRYFLPPNSAAPLAFYFFGDLLNDYTSLELISTISTMETFQKIYRPEIYNANSVAGKRFQPSLRNANHSLTRIRYDREERSQLAVKQGKFAEENFIQPYQAILDQWSARCAL
ncbi:DUF1852 domain-containing protein [Thalassolituus maritimus]|uniref:DUF1852 domain-containing protein n=1 Tax=Thalassolituus maritimus TaxID=484498 RepID=A0ABQ0A203_9GAMM